MPESIESKARRLIADDRVHQDETHPTVWWVQGGNISRDYRVQVTLDSWGAIDFITCTCPHGLNAGGGDAHCYHVEAVKILLNLGGVRDMGQKDPHDPLADDEWSVE